MIATEPARAVALIDQACTLGDGAACVHLAGMYAAGTHVAKDDRKVGALLERACAAHHAGACTQLGDRVARRDRARAAALYRTACDGDDAAGCARTGGIDDLVKACDLGLHESCAAAAARFERGRDAAADAARARTLYGQACDHDLGAACAALAAMIGDGRGGDRRWTDAIALAKKACELRAPGACATVTRMQAHPPAVRCATIEECTARCDEQLGAGCRRLAELEVAASPSDCDDSDAAYQRGCEAGDAASCLAAGNRGMTPEASYEAGCTAGSAEACTLLHYLRAVADPPDAHELELLHRACTRAPASSACVWYARTSAHEEAARRLYRAACQRGDARGCRLLGQSLGAGLPSVGDCGCDDGPPRDPTPREAMQRIEQACALGDAIACDALDKPIAASCRADQPTWESRLP